MGMKRNQRATPEEIYKHAGEIIYRFQLLGGPTPPYDSRPGTCGRMRRFFWLEEDKVAVTLHGGSFDAWHPWRLPGVSCPTCGAMWSDVGHYSPSINLSHLAERKEFVKARPEPFAEFARLRELVRPLGGQLPLRAPEPGG